MSSTGFVIAGTGAEEQRGGVRQWTNTANITADDGTETTVSLGSAGDKTWTLYGYNLGLSLPEGAVIRGIEARIEVRKSVADVTSFDDVVLRKADGTFTTTDRSDAAEITTTVTAYTYGSATDLWGETWAKADVEDADFGAGFAFLCAASGSNARADYIALNVHYDVELTPTAGFVRMLGNAVSVETTYTLAPSAGLARMLGDTASVETTWDLSPSNGVSRIQGATPVVELAWTPEVGLARMIGQTPTLTESEGGFWHKAGPATGAWSRAPTAL